MSGAKVPDRKKGLFAAVTAPFFIALCVMVAKVASHAGADPLLITGLSCLMSLPFLLALQPLVRTMEDVKVLFTELRRPFLQLLVSRSLIGSILIVIGFTMTTAIKAVLLLRVEALFVFLWSVYFHKEEASWRKIALLLLLVLGSVLVVIPSSTVAAGVGGANGVGSGVDVGDILIVVALMFLSFSYIPTAPVVARVGPTSLNIAANAVAGAFIMLVMLVARFQAVASLTPAALGDIFAYSMVFSVIGVNLYYFAFKTIKPWMVASFLSLEVVYGIPLAWCFHREALTILQGVGSVMVMAATAGIGLLGATAENEDS